MDEKDRFAAAVNAIIDSHRKLYDLLLETFRHYAPSSGGLPPRAKRASRLLDCEVNGAHKLIEDLATAAKSVVRGGLGEYPDLLIAECRDFLDFLDDHLRSSECAAVINDIRQTEEAFVNLIKGLSGCDPNMTTRSYSRRIDKFVRDLKGLFRDLGHSVVKLEYELAERGKNADAVIEKRSKPTRVRRGVGGKGPRTEFMKKQLRAFVRFLSASNYDGDLKKINALAAQCWAKNKSKWDKAAKATGQQKGYSGARVLADAYRKSE